MATLSRLNWLEHSDRQTEKGKKKEGNPAHLIVYGNNGYSGVGQKTQN